MTKQDKKNSNDNTKIIIEGETESGKIFRPSDWAERFSGNLSTFRNGRIHYSPLLKPSFDNGKKCLILDQSLKQTNPELYEHILEFARTNKLKIFGDEKKSS